MTQRHSSSFSAAVCTGVDPRRCSLVRTSVPNEHTDMLAYRHPSNGSEQYLLPSLDSAAPVVQSFTCGPDFSDLDYADGLLPAIDNSQYAYYPQNDYFRSLSEMPQSSRRNLQMNPFAGSMEPYFVYPQGAFPPQSQAQFTSSMYSLTMAPEMMSHTTPSAINPGMMSFKTMHDEYYTTPTWQQNLPIFAPQDYDQATSTDDGMDGPDGSDELDEDETTNYDKPYAQLIYEALMQAPGHRMLLRDIYDWFIANTRKPRESGTNGWQNSIRHNLSMNQVGFVHLSKSGSTLTFNRHSRMTRTIQLYHEVPRKLTACGS